MRLVIKILLKKLFDNWDEWEKNEDHYFSKTFPSLIKDPINGSEEERKIILQIKEIITKNELKYLKNSSNLKKIRDDNISLSAKIAKNELKNIIELYIQNNEFDKAESLSNLTHDWNKSSWNVAPFTLYEFTKLKNQIFGNKIKALCEEGKSDEAEKLNSKYHIIAELDFKELKNQISEKIKGDIETLCEKGDFDEVEKLNLKHHVISDFKRFKSDFIDKKKKQEVENALIKLIKENKIFEADKLAVKNKHLLSEEEYRKFKLNIQKEEYERNKQVLKNTLDELINENKIFEADKLAVEKERLSSTEENKKIRDYIKSKIIERIKNNAIKSANFYYNYLANKRGGGEKIISIQNCEQGDNGGFKLKLSGRIINIDAIFFRIKNADYDTSQIKIIEYDDDENILLVQPNETLSPILKQLIPNGVREIKIVSDLKFLVKNVQTWYEKNGSNVSLPQKISFLKDKLESIEYLKDLPPFDNQKESLQNILSNPFSYVWGAPGTGKTQVVLAYAVLQYIKNNKKVLILTSTNNALEQTLRGIISMIDKQNIKRECIIRLGTPTKNFAETFYEVCEAKSIQKRLEKSDEKISNLKKEITYKQASKVLDLFNNTFFILNQKLEIIKKDKKSLEEKNNDKKSNLDNTIKSLEGFEEQKKNVLRKTSSILYKLKKLFLSDKTKEEEYLEEIQQKIDLKEEEKQILIDKILIYSNEIKKLEVTYQNKFNEFNILIKKAKEENKNFNDVLILKYFDKLSISNWQEIKKNIEIFIENLNIHKGKEIILEDLEKNLKELQIEREKLSKLSTDERIGSAKVIACTLDKYIKKFSENKMDVEHIFLDEVSSASEIKALTLFNNNVPITFLGDHMQLHPVCEMNDDEEVEGVDMWRNSAYYIETLFNGLSIENFTPEKLNTTFLDKTHRFGQNLAEVLGDYVYKKEFNSANKGGEVEILYVNAKKEDAERHQRISKTEVGSIKNIVTNLKKEENKDYVILTPYNPQRRLLEEGLPEEKSNILTVHKAQGSEWDTVILSVVDTSDKFFTNSTNEESKGKNLINTAVSRVKKKLIIVCDYDYWINQKGQLLYELIKIAKEYKI